MTHRDFGIDKLSRAEAEFINSKIIEFNASRVPFTQDEPFVNVAFALRGKDQDLIGGIQAQMYCWRCLYIDVLWVSESHQRRGYGAALLQRVEDEARQMGCSLAHLDTFDFQAKDFYLRQGYEVFGLLEDCPPRHKRFFLKKRL